MKCPVCNCDLKPHTVEDVEIEHCPTCKGMWFERDKLRQAKDHADSDLNWMDFPLWEHLSEFSSKEKRTKCPACQEPMYVLQYSDTGVEVDYCASCVGAWLERGEFKKIVSVLEQELLSKPSSELALAALKEAQDILTGPESVPSEWGDFTTVVRMLNCRILAEHPKLHEILLRIQATNPFQ